MKSLRKQKRLTGMLITKMFLTICFMIWLFPVNAFAATETTWTEIQGAIMLNVNRTGADWSYTYIPAGEFNGAEHVIDIHEGTIVTGDVDVDARYIVQNAGTITGGNILGPLVNNAQSGIINDGTRIHNELKNFGIINGGEFIGSVENGGYGATGTITGGKFVGNVDNYGTINGGTFRTQPTNNNSGTTQNITIDPNLTIGDYNQGGSGGNNTPTSTTYYVKAETINGGLYEDQSYSVTVPTDRILKYGDTIQNDSQFDIYIYLGENPIATLTPSTRVYSIPAGEYTYSFSIRVSGNYNSEHKLILTPVTSGTTQPNPNPGNGVTPQPDNNNPNTSENNKTYTHTHNFQWIVTTQPTEKTDGCNSLMCEGCGAVEATQPISYFNNITNNVMKEIKAAPEKGTVTIDDEFLRCFSNEMVEELLARPDLTVVVNFTDKGVNYSFTIPAGKAPTDGQEWYGYYYLGSVYGWTLMENVM
mgnify:CR=1 FL=1